MVKRIILYVAVTAVLFLGVVALLEKADHALDYLGITRWVDKRDQSEHERTRDTGPSAAAHRLIGEGRNLYDNSAGSYEALNTAEQKFLQALPLLRQANDTMWEASTFNDLGRVYAARGQFDKAVEYYEESLKIKRRVKAPTA